MKNYFQQLVRKLMAVVVGFKDEELMKWFTGQVKTFSAFKNEKNTFISEIQKMRRAMLGNETAKASRDVSYSAKQIMSLWAKGKYHEAYMALFKPNMTRIEYDPVKGQILVVAYISPALKDVSQKIRYYYETLPRRLMMRANENSRAVEKWYYFMDYSLQRYGNYDALLSLLPPYKKSAWIFQNLHYVSFDGTAGYLEGNCELTVVKDKQSDSFSLNFRPSQSGSSLIINVGLKIYRVYVNGKFEAPKSSILPYSDQYITVRREGQLVRVILADGLQVELHTASQIWRFLAPGELHGRLDGLLGSNNYHPHDDYGLKSGALAKENAERISSWASGICSSRTSRADFPKNLVFDTHTMSGSSPVCNALFLNPASHLSRCRYAVNPAPYYHLCLYAAVGQNPYDQMTSHVCDVEKAYVAACIAESVNVRVRKSCVKCGDDLIEGDRSEFKNYTPTKDRYIFIVEDSSCLSSRASLFVKLVDGLSSGNDGRAVFSLLQYGGDSFQTIPIAMGSLEGNAVEFKQALGRLLSPSNDNQQVFASSSRQALSIIDEAVNMASPAGYRDQVLLFSCSSCSYGVGSSLGMLINKMKTHGISLHYFPVATFNPENVLGMDGKFVYRLMADGDVVQLTREREMRPPRDGCASLALETEGSVWAAEKPTVLLKALTEMNRRIKWFNQPTTLNRHCVCRSDKYGNGELECTKAK
jgi:hypothetical protein